MILTIVLLDILDAFSEALKAEIPSITCVIVKWNFNLIIKSAIDDIHQLIVKLISCSEDLLGGRFCDNWTYRSTCVALEWFTIASVGKRGVSLIESSVYLIWLESC